MLNRFFACWPWSFTHSPLRPKPRARDRPRERQQWWTARYQRLDHVREAAGTLRCSCWHHNLRVPTPQGTPRFPQPALICGLIKGNQWLIVPDHKAGYFLGETWYWGGPLRFPWLLVGEQGFFRWLEVRKVGGICLVGCVFPWRIHGKMLFFYLDLPIRFNSLGIQSPSENGNGT